MIKYIASHVKISKSVNGAVKMAQSVKCSLRNTNSDHNYLITQWKTWAYRHIAAMSALCGQRQVDPCQLGNLAEPATAKPALCSV